MINQPLLGDKKDIPKSVKRIAFLYFWLGLLGIILSPASFLFVLFIGGMSDSARSMSGEEFMRAATFWVFIPVLISIFFIAIAKALKKMRWWVLYFITAWFIFGIIGIVSYKSVGRAIEDIGVSNVYLIAFQVVIIFYLWRGYRRYYKVQ